MATDDYLAEAFVAVSDELARQDILAHGGNTEEFDQSNSQNDWIAYLNAYSGRAAQKVFKNERQKEDFRINMVKVAALALRAAAASSKGYC